jgi:hypothetical protein
MSLGSDILRGKSLPLRSQTFNLKSGVVRNLSRAHFILKSKGYVNAVRRTGMSTGRDISRKIPAL